MCSSRITITGSVSRLTTTTTGVFANESSYKAMFAPDGRSVVFETQSTNLIPGGTGFSTELLIATLGSRARPYVEDAPPLRLVEFVNLSDPDSAHYAGGTLTVAITAGSVAGDRLVLTGSGAAAVGVEVLESEVRFFGVTVGTLTTTATSFSVAFNDRADDFVVRAIAEAAHISSSSQDPTNAARTVTFTLVDGGGTAGGGQDMASFSRVVPFVSVNDLPVGRPDRFTMVENGTLTGNLFADNGNGVDFDPEDPLAIATVNFQPVVFGQPMNLGAGETITIQADGSFVFHPNGLFEDAPAPGSGASPHTYGFFYSLVGASGGHILNSITIEGIDNDDVLNGTIENDTLRAGIGDDELYGHDGDDTLHGEDGNDLLDGGNGFDHLYGGPGDDVYVVDLAGDVVAEAAGEGFDTIFASASMTLAAGSEVELIVAGFSVFSQINLTGNQLANQLVGSFQANTLNGRAGDDLLLGGDGNDTLIGGAGTDLLFGEAGADRFLFQAVSDSGPPAVRSDGRKYLPDRIADFETGVDRIDLSPIDAIAGTAGNDAFTFIGLAAFTGHAGQLRYEQSAGISQILADLDGDGLADLQIVAMTGTLVASDFIL